jgi:protein-S-isoprenylcysteine O-methyltransferase Ste14
MGPEIGLAAALVGGGMATATHSAKAGTRVLINTSPEPVTNWTASIAEDLAVIGGIWAALNHPWVFLGLLILFILLLVWLLPKVFRGVKKVFAFIGRLLGAKQEENVIVQEAEQTKTK